MPLPKRTYHDADDETTGPGRLALASRFPVVLGGGVEWVCVACGRVLDCMMVFKMVAVFPDELTGALPPFPQPPPPPPAARLQWYGRGCGGPGCPCVCGRAHWGQKGRRTPRQLLQGPPPSTSPLRFFHHTPTEPPQNQPQTHTNANSSGLGSLCLCLACLTHALSDLVRLCVHVLGLPPPTHPLHSPPHAFLLLLVNFSHV